MNRRITLLLLLVAVVLPVCGQQVPTRPGKTPVLVSASGYTSGAASSESYLNSVLPRSALSANGRFVVFQSDAPDLIADLRDGNAAPDIFLRDRQTNQSKLISVNRDGNASGNGSSSTPFLSADGRFVAFESSANDLVANDDNGLKDIFVRDAQTGVTQLVTVNTSGAASRGGVLFVWLYGLSADGRFVLFTTEAQDLVDNDKNDSADLYVRDLVAGKTMLVSVNVNGQASGNRSSLTSGGFFSFDPVLSANGRFVAFVSYVNDLTENDQVCYGDCDGTNGFSDIFVRDLVSGSTTLISVNARGNNSGNQPSVDPTISADGRRVAFRSFATDLVTNDHTPQADIYVRDLTAQTTTLASVNLTGDNGGTNGRGTGLNAQNPLLSPDGRYVAFSSAAVDLAPNKTSPAGQDLFVRDLTLGITTLASVNLAGKESGGFNAVAAAFNADGRWLVFRSAAPDLAPNDFNQTDDVFVRDVTAGQTRLVSVNRWGQSATGRSLTADISADGSAIAFDSDAPDIAPDDHNRSADVFVFARVRLSRSQLTDEK